MLEQPLAVPKLWMGTGPSWLGAARGLGNLSVCTRPSTPSCREPPSPVFSLPHWELIPYSRDLGLFGPTDGHGHALPKRHPWSVSPLEPVAQIGFTACLWSAMWIAELKSL